MKTSKSIVPPLGGGYSPNIVYVEKGENPRLFHLHTHERYFGRRAKAADLIAAMDGALTITLTQPTFDPMNESARLSIVPRSFTDLITNPYDGFLKKLRDAGIPYALRLCSRNEDGGFWPHVQGLAVPESLRQLESFAEKSGLVLHLAEGYSPAAWARYILKSHQAKRYDKSQSLTFWASMGAK